MLKLGVQHYLAPALSKACHPQNRQRTWLPESHHIYTFPVTTAKSTLTFHYRMLKNLKTKQVLIWGILSWIVFIVLLIVFGG